MGAERGMLLFAGTGSSLTLPCAKGTINVVEAANAALDVEVLVVVLAQLLGHQLLQAICVLGFSGPGVGLLQVHVVGLQLAELGVDAGAGSIEEPGKRREDNSGIRRHLETSSPRRIPEPEPAVPQEVASQSRIAGCPRKEHSTP